MKWFILLLTLVLYVNGSAINNANELGNTGEEIQGKGVLKKVHVRKDLVEYDYYGEEEDAFKLKQDNEEAFLNEYEKKVVSKFPKKYSSKHYIGEKKLRHVQKRDVTQESGGTDVLEPSELPVIDVKKAELIPVRRKLFRVGCLEGYGRAPDGSCQEIEN